MTQAPHDPAGSGARPETQTTAQKVVFLKVPLVLITQIQRSGGTLLSQLFDGHPQICAHPHELHIGRPEKWDWPNLDMTANPEVWFSSLYEKRLEKFYQKGYVKPGSNPFAAKEVHSFAFDPQIQQAAFHRAIEIEPPRSQRDVLNAYFTSFFAAWSDVSVSPVAKFVTAFCPRVLMASGSVERFINDYPDGHIVSSVRDPRTWYASSSRHNKQYADVKAAIDLWKISTQGIVRLKQVKPDYIFVSTYEALVQDTEGTMAKAADFLSIDYTESMLMPTYASKPILPNSSYARNSYGVNTESTKTAAELSDDDRAYIERVAMPLYEEAAAL